MEIRDYEALKKKLCKQLEEIASHKTFDMGDIEVIDKLVHSIEKIGKIMEMEDGGYSQEGMGGYSQTGRNGMWNAEGSYRGSDPYMNDSYAGRRGMHYVRGHYSHGDEVENEIRRMMEESNMSSSDKVTLERALDIIRR